MRPTKLSPEVQEIILTSIETGLTYEAACEAAGISYATMREWIRRGEGKDERIKTDEFAKFAEGMRVAKAKGQAKLVAEISANPDWRAKAWILERRYADVWSKNALVEKRAQEKIDRLVKDLEWYLPVEIYDTVVATIKEVTEYELSPSKVKLLEAVQTLAEKGVYDKDKLREMGKKFKEIKAIALDKVED